MSIPMTAPRVDPPILRFVRAALGGESDGLPDAELLSRFVDTGDQGAFELLVWRHAGMVVRACRSVLRDHHTSEDVAQAVFMTLAKGAGKISKKGALAGWLHSVAWRLSKRVAARRARKATLPILDLAETGDRESGSARDVLDDERNELIHQEIERLPENYRLPIILCYFEGLTYAQAAKRLDWPLGTVNGRIARACEVLQKRLTQRGVALSAAGIAGLLASTPTPSVAATFVTSVVRASIAYAAKQAMIPGVSQLTMDLAREAGRTALGVKIAIATTVMICGLALGATAYAPSANSESSGLASPLSTSDSAGPIESARNSSRHAIPELPEIPVLNPITEERRKEIKPEVVEAYRKRGATFGGCVQDENSLIRNFVFSEGEKSARLGIPAFDFSCWDPQLMKEGMLPEPGANTEKRLLWETDNEPLPEADVNCGIVLKTNPNDKCLKKIGKLESMTILMLENFHSDSLKLLGSPKKVRVLSLTQCDVTADGLKELATWKCLTDLHLVNCTMRQSDFKELKGLKNLQVLDINFCRLSDSGIKYIAAMPRLTELKIREDMISDECVTEFTPAVNIRVLELRNTQISSEGMAKLPIAGELEKLSWSWDMHRIISNFRGPFNTDMRLSQIVSSGKYPKLKELRLPMFGSGDAKLLLELKQLEAFHALQSFGFDPKADRESLAKLKNLTKFDCRVPDNEDDSPLNPDQIKELKKILPNCKVVP